MTDDRGSDSSGTYVDHEARARAARAALAERLGDAMPELKRPEPGTEPPAARSDFDPCAGWFAAADLAYSLATSASDIDSAIEWTITGDNYTVAGEGCHGAVDSL